MTGQGDGVYQAVIPVSMISGINRFWYYLDARGRSAPGQAVPGIVQSRWYPVTVVEVGDGSSGGGAGEKSTVAPVLWWLLGGAAVAGGAVALEHHNDDGGGSPSPPPPAPANTGGGRDEEEEEEDEESPAPPAPAPCQPSGSASVSLASACQITPPIAVEVCSSCPNSLIEVTSSWGAVDRRSNYNNEGCGVESDAPFFLTQPPGVPSISVGQFTISVQVNGQLIGTYPWPDAGYFDCL